MFLLKCYNACIELLTRSMSEHLITGLTCRDLFSPYTKAYLFERYNEKRYQIGPEKFLVCDLKRTWTLSRTREAIQTWIDMIALHEPNGVQRAVMKKLLPLIDTQCLIRMYGDGRFAVADTEGKWYEIMQDGFHRLLPAPPFKETVFLSSRASIEVAQDVVIQVSATQRISAGHVVAGTRFVPTIYWDLIFEPLVTFIDFIPQSMRHAERPAQGMVEIYKYEDNRIETFFGFGWLPGDALVKATKALEMAALIMEDYENFLNDPYCWILKVAKQPKPGDAVLGGIRNFV